MKDETPAHILKKLRDAVALAGSQKAFAATCGVKQSYMCDMLHGRRPVSDSTLLVLGYRRKVVYERVSEK